MSLVFISGLRSIAPQKNSLRRRWHRNAAGEEGTPVALLLQKERDLGVDAVTGDLLAVDGGWGDSVRTSITLST
jgi:hypothetical protein